MKTPSGQRIQLLLNTFRVLTHESIENVTKIALENRNVFFFQRFFVYLGVIVAICSYKTAFISPNNPIGQQIHLLLNVFNVLIHGIFC